LFTILGRLSTVALGHLGFKHDLLVQGVGGLRTARIDELPSVILDAVLSLNVAGFPCLQHRLDRAETPTGKSLNC